MTYQALMFDIDGTLTNSQPAYTTVMREGTCYLWQTI
ncbi:Phosphoglycolate phosphatase [Lactiplantibacillus plantarum subsp. plantarum]|uniref:Phosphoglycolate phosphatase n=1 Tax=Lactiplantibacillus plantarum subsp. plantarum TaxID=337330 RepID=A0A2S3U180_LACPN|nr:Phosphoglycolate phosphatase [Lactiplantibacillus plantarum subsp. plantarum]